MLRIAPANWGASSKHLKTWYKVVIEKRLTYAAGVWALGLKKQAITKLLSTPTAFFTNDS